MSTLLERALKLPIRDRIRLADELYNSVGDPPGTPLSDAQIAELERRLEYYRENPDEVLPWEQVRDKWRRGE